MPSCEHNWRFTSRFAKAGYWFIRWYCSKCRRIEILQEKAEIDETKLYR